MTRPLNRTLILTDAGAVAFSEDLAQFAPPIGTPTPTPTPTPSPTLAVLTLSSATVRENAAAGVVIGAIGGKTPGSTLSMIDDAGGRVTLSGRDLVTTAAPFDFEAATSASVTVRETLTSATNSPRNTILPLVVTNDASDDAPPPAPPEFTTAPSITPASLSPRAGEDATLAFGVVEGDTILRGEIVDADTGEIIAVIQPGVYTLPAPIAPATTRDIFLLVHLTGTTDVIGDSNVVTVAAAGSTSLTVAQANAPGTVPFAWSTEIGDNVYAGDVWRVQTSADGAKNPDGSYVTPTQDITKQISPSEFAPGYVSDWSADAVPAPSRPFVTQPNLSFFQLRVERYTEAGTVVVAPWSNELSDTVLIATTALSTTTGVNKNQFLIVEGRTATMDRGDVGAPCLTRATQAAQFDRFQFEVEIVSLAAGGIDTYIGLDDGSNDFNAYRAPGNGSNPGVSLTVSLGGSRLNLGNSNDQGVAGVQQGDVITVRGDKASGEVSFYRTRPGTATIQLGSTHVVALSSWWAGLGHTKPASATANFGQDDFVKPLDGGFEFYG